MKIKDGLILKKVMGSYMIVSTMEDAAFNSMQTINETGAFLWELLQQDTTVEQMTERVTEEYDIDSETAKQDIEAFVEKLKKSNLLD